ncbi:hypothetical protein ACJ41O_007769 [Fusarium nematophilum]
MAPSEFYLRLQKGMSPQFAQPLHTKTNWLCFKGIVGGFAPPTPQVVITVTKQSDSDSISITVGKPTAAGPELQESQKTLQTADREALIDELYGLLKDLPVPDPPGSEDIYGLDTGITWGSDALEWENTGPEGCDTQTSVVQAGAGEKQKFKRAVEIVYEIAG